MVPLPELFELRYGLSPYTQSEFTHWDFFTDVENLESGRYPVSKVLHELAVHRQKKGAKPRSHSHQLAYLACRMTATPR